MIIAFGAFVKGDLEAIVNSRGHVWQVNMGIDTDGN